MAYVPSLREIPLDREPHKSVLDALTPDPFADPYVGVDLDEASASEVAHLNQCKACRDILGVRRTDSGLLTASLDGGEI